MIIDVRGMKHPDHLKKFKRELEGFCTVHEEVEVLLDNSKDDLKRFEMFVRACRGHYVITEEDGYLRMKIEAPFCLCG